MSHEFLFENNIGVFYANYCVSVPSPGRDCLNRQPYHYRFSVPSLKIHPETLGFRRHVSNSAVLPDPLESITTYYPEDGIEGKSLQVKNGPC